MDKYLDTTTYSPPGGYNMAWSTRDKLYCLQMYWKAVELGYSGTGTEVTAWSLAAMATDDMIRADHGEPTGRLRFSPTWQKRLEVFRGQLLATPATATQAIS